MKYCTYCGKENRDQARFCGHCGQPCAVAVPLQTVQKSNLPQAPPSRVATLLSCLWPGLGQIYQGHILRGASFIIIQGCLWPESFFFSRITSSLILGPLLFLSPPTAFWIYGMIDSKRISEGKNKSRIFPTAKSAAVVALGAIAILLFYFAAFIQHLENKKTLADKRPTANKGVTTDTEKQALDKIVARSDAQQKLGQMGIPYTEEQFLNEAKGGNTTVVELFLLAGMNPNTKKYLFKSDFSALAFAVENGRAETVKVLLKYGADPNAELMFGGSLLIRAARDGQTEIAQALLEHGAYVNARDSLGRTALREAKSNKHDDTVRVLQKAGAVD